MINITSYNQIADQWAAVRDGSFVSELIVDFVRRIKPNGNILDIGCGTGLPNARYFSEHNLHVTGFDASEEMIRLAKSHNIANAEFSVREFFDFTSQEQFDGIIAWDSLFHFPKDKQQEIYPKIYNLLKPGGYLIFTHGKRDDEKNDQMFGQPFYYSAMAKDSLCDLLIKLGFEIEYAHEDFMEKGSHRELIVMAKRVR